MRRLPYKGSGTNFLKLVLNLPRKNKMSEHGAALQTYNLELVKCILFLMFILKIITSISGLEDLKIKRNEIVDIIYKEEAEKVVLEKNLEALQNRLALLNKSLEHHKNIYENYDKTINDTENGFKKILESSQALLHLAQHESNKIDCSNSSKKAVFVEYAPINEPNY
ncbi:hypothetical protein NQ314_013248 [Rhamnusium bicolor]|uniref:Uncharacterized protein n=1 Tax=Rhamnusium bicolor TaxID=1586634 RepID=A0AAV8X9H0_9CUCU|nr:hypothetical protein NQ314_013248 [Rhamnusium bicolor]